MADEKPFYIGHRERLRQKFLNNQLAEYEKLELLLGYVIPRCDVRPLAHKLLEHFGGVAQVLSAPMDKLLDFNGLGQNTVIFLKAVYQIILDGYKGVIEQKPIFHNHTILIDYCKWLLNQKTTEECWVLYLDIDYKLIKEEMHAKGESTFVQINPREILKQALLLNASYIVLIHNHPFENDGFSKVDIDISNQINEIFNNLNIKLYDHILISKNKVFSAKNMGLI